MPNPAPEAYRIISKYHLPKIHLPNDQMIIDKFGCSPSEIRAHSYGDAVGFRQFKGIQIGPMALTRDETSSLFTKLRETGEIPDAIAEEYYRETYHLLSDPQKRRVSEKLVHYNPGIVVMQQLDSHGETQAALNIDPSDGITVPGFDNAFALDLGLLAAETMRTESGDFGNLNLITVPSRLVDKVNSFLLYRQAH